MADIDRDPTDLGLSPSQTPGQGRLMPPLPGEHVCFDGWVVPLDDPDHSPQPCLVCRPHLKYERHGDSVAWRATPQRRSRPRR
jgi:hypothetical protein